MRSYRHEAVELAGLNHLAEPELLFINGGLAGFTGGPG